ncbi:MAG: RNA methyltransferase [Bacilli bacterium]|jgi:TrmH family RNA methyltransferase|nr:RNA methyltransferase [Bacilli bacterium]
MEIITSTQNNRIKEIIKLKQKKYRDKNRLFIIETNHLIEEALKHYQLRLIITDDYTYKSDKCDVLYVSSNIMKKISNLNSVPSLIGICEYIDNDIDYSFDVVVFDDIQDPSNLGNMMRTCLAFNINNIILSNNCVDCYNPKCIQASQGAIFQLNIIRKDLLDYLDILKKENYMLIGTSLTKAISIENRDKIMMKKAFFLGNEGQGLQEEIINNMDINYYIPINNIDSLNVGNALAIILYEFNKDKYDKNI